MIGLRKYLDLAQILFQSFKPPCRLDQGLSKISRQTGTGQRMRTMKRWTASPQFLVNILVNIMVLKILIAGSCP